MVLPEGILKKSKSALAVLSALFGIAGILICAASLFALLSATAALEKILAGQLDAAIASASDLEKSIIQASEGAGHGADAAYSLSSSLSQYSSSSKSLADSLLAISSIPIIGSDGKISSAASSAKKAAESFSNSSYSLNSTAQSLSELSASLRKIGEDVRKERKLLLDAKEKAKGIFFWLYAAEILAASGLCLLFSSVCFVSFSVLLHYRKDEGKGGQ
ncbi:MAG: hypothetical protein N3F07_02365 [Candidatus Micrarchaeota archaeon]|nr:hypothetical protein [Candidatus Micrarchaeota archaeon]